jgi:hypothetical protein
MGAVNSLAQTNVLAMWSPLAEMMKDTSQKMAARKAA